MTTIDNLPPDIRLIAAISRLIDIHQSRRDAGGAYIPDVPEKAGFNLYLALSIINCLHDIEIDRGVGFAPVSELVGKVRKCVPNVTDSDIEYCIANLKQGREIHYGVPAPNGDVTYARTWETTPLIDVEEGFSQVQISENGRLLLRVSTLKESWLYSDLDADRLIKAIERSQFQDIPIFCRAMTMDVAAKSKQLSGSMERPSLVALRTMLINDGSAIADSLATAAETIGGAIDLIFSDQVQASFDVWAEQEKVDFYIGNLQADLELVMQNVESLSRQFLTFIEVAQKVRNEGVESIRFLQIADSLVSNGDESAINKTEALLHVLMPIGLSVNFFHPSILVGEADLRANDNSALAPVRGFTVDPTLSRCSSTLLEFIKRNRDVVMQRLQKGPTSFSEMVVLTGFVLEAGDTPLDFFGVYASPGLMLSKTQRIVVGLTGAQANLVYANSLVEASDPVMFIEEISNDTF